MKTCLRCQQPLSLDKFHSRQAVSKYTGKVATHYNSYCKDCNILNCKDRRQSVIGLITDMYNGQIGSSKRRGHPPPAYTQEHLRHWLDGHPSFLKMCADWASSGYERWSKPSIDRLDDSKPYTFQNIRLVTWEENSDKYHQQLVEQGNQTCRPVQQFKDGVLVATYHSVQEASRKTGAAAGNITRCCSGQYKTSKGYVWRYVDE